MKNSLEYWSKPKKSQGVRREENGKKEVEGAVIRPGWLWRHLDLIHGTLEKVLR